MLRKSYFFSILSIRKMIFYQEGSVLNVVNLRYSTKRSVSAFAKQEGDCRALSPHPRARQSSSGFAKMLTDRLSATCPNLLEKVGLKMRRSPTSGLQILQPLLQTKQLIPVLRRRNKIQIFCSRLHLPFRF